MKEQLRIAIGQLKIIDGDKEANLRKMQQALHEAHTLHADLLILPELCVTGMLAPDEFNALAEPREGETFRRIQHMLERYPVHLLYSFPELGSEKDYYITTCLVDDKGVPLAYYRKTHLFSEEAVAFSKGNSFTACDLFGVKVGLLTCYDIEFPEPARELALNGTQLLIVNSANMTPYEMTHRVFITARAMENQIFVVYCNRIGSNSTYDYHGQSAVVAPDGKMLLEFEDDVEAVKCVDISLSHIHASQQVFHYLRDRRAELYR